MRSLNRGLIAVMICLMTFVSGNSAIAIEPVSLTPVAEKLEAGLCTVEPADYDHVREIIRFSDSDPDAVFDLTSPFFFGETTAKRADARDVRALGLEYLACTFNADVSRLIALYSDAYLARIGSSVAAMIGSEYPMTESNQLDSWGILGESDVTVLDDGRFAVTLRVGYQLEEPSGEWIELQTLQFIAIEQKGVWKIDDMRVATPASLDCFDCDNDPTDLPECADGIVLPFSDLIPPSDEKDAETATATESPEGCGPSDDSNHLQGNGYDGWILPGFYTDDDPIWYFDDDAGEILPYDLQLGDIEEAEAGLEEYVLTLYTGSADIVDRLSDGTYLRQYLGYETGEGRLLVINAFAEESGITEYIDPSVNLVMVNDGGDHFWQAIYNLDTGEFMSFYVNGYA